MTPDLIGARRTPGRSAPGRTGRANRQTESGGRTAGFGRLASQGEVDVTHGRILYLGRCAREF